ncbi:MAG: hypothetical protein KJ062_07625 [Thermoanaerobaculia bacterium]|nr:hypothetical protein [Thermoanaerobaculia bacterium]
MEARGPDDLDGTRRWIFCFWQDEFERLDSLPKRAGATRGVLMIPPPAGDITVALGLWAEINTELGTLLDVAETEEIPVDRLSDATSVVSRYISRLDGEGSRVLRFVVGRQETPHPARDLVAELPADELAGHLRALHDFLQASLRENRSVSVAL